MDIDYDLFVEGYPTTVPQHPCKDAIFTSTPDFKSGSGKWYWREERGGGSFKYIYICNMYFIYIYMYMCVTCIYIYIFHIHIFFPFQSRKVKDLCRHATCEAKREIKLYTRRPVDNRAAIAAATSRFRPQSSHPAIEVRVHQGK